MRYPNSKWNWDGYINGTGSSRPARAGFNDPLPPFKPRPPCSHKNRAPVPYSPTPEVTIWGGPQPQKDWNLKTVLVVNLLESKTKTEDVWFPIRNWDIPDDNEMFDVLIDALIQRASKGDEIYVHCFGGHGRTGLVLGAVAAKLGIEDPVEHVRKHYCQRAIETPEQEQYVTDYADRSL